ncbi:unnamed protein product [Effrenium voratum]|uniref:Uncharacterized protein n=1 Tax=Effrenium voratum TaxID=2562239 RepID=A0AA36HND0_9DINO|nr:unnamed protein product [Effrenium voratum]
MTPIVCVSKSTIEAALHQLAFIPASTEFRGHGMARAPLLIVIPRVLSYDFQYFLSDLPLREGSFASEVIQYLQTAIIPDKHHENVDPGVFTNAYADSDFNSPSYRQRHMCQRPRAQAPQAEILEASTEEVSKFMLSAEFEFSVPGHLKIRSQTCFVCWTDTVCDDDITITGVLRVQSLVRSRGPCTWILDFRA